MVNYSMFLSCIKKPVFVLLAVLTALPVLSCGRKGDPTLRSFEKPLPVREVTAIHREAEVVISWKYPSVERGKIRGFYVEKAEVTGREADDKGPVFKNLGFLKNDASVFADKDFITTRNYLYTVRPYSLRDVIGDASPPVKVKPLPLYDPPTGLSYSLTDGSVKIQWDWVCNAIRHNVYKSYVKSKYGASPINAKPLEDTFFQDRLETLKPVYYTVRALRDTAIRDEGYPSIELEVNPASFVPSKPTGLKYVPSGEKVHLLWNENPETWVKGYRIYRKRAGEAGFSLAGEAAAPAFTDSGPAAPGTFYHITAVGPEKESAASESAEALPAPER